jgi:hypothetical protein
MIAGLSRIRLIEVIRMNVACSRWFVTIKPEPEATVSTSSRIQNRHRQRRTAIAKSNSQNTDCTDYADNNTDKQTATERALLIRFSSV